MNQRDFILKVNEWLVATHKEMLASGDYTQQEFDHGELPEMEYFEVDLHDVLGSFDNYSITCVMVREWLEDHLFATCDSEVVAECRNDDPQDLLFMFRIATTDAFRMYLQLEFEKKYCKDVDIVSQ